MFVHFVLLWIYLQVLIVTVSDGSEPRVSKWIRSNPLSWFKWGSYASSLLICFPKLIEIALVVPVAGSPWLIAPIRFGMSRLFLGSSSCMRAQPRSMRTLSRHAIEEHQHMPSRYPEPNWQMFCAQPHCAGANNSVCISHQHVKYPKYHHTYSIWLLILLFFKVCSAFFGLVDKLSD